MMQVKISRPTGAYVRSRLQEVTDELDLGFAKQAAINQFKEHFRHLLRITNNIDQVCQWAETVIDKYFQTAKDTEIEINLEIPSQLSTDQDFQRVGRKLIESLELLCHDDHDNYFIREVQAWVGKFKPGGVKRNRNNELESIHDHAQRISESGRQVRGIRTQEQPELPVAYIYDSKHGDPRIQLNTRVDTRYGNKIDCGPLSFWFLQNHKTYHAPLSSLQTMQPRSLAEKNFEIDRVDFRADQYIVFKLDGLFNVLADLCEDMEVGDVKTLLFQSESHMMAIVVEYKHANYFSIKVYDPNFTAVHSRILSENIDDIRCLTVHDVLPVGMPERYFRSFQVGMLGVYDNPHQLRPELSEVNMQWVNDSLSVQDIAGYLFFGLGHNSPTLVASMLQQVESVTNSNEILYVFSSENEYCTTGLMRAMSLGFSAVVELFTRFVLELQSLSEPEKVRILLANSKRGQSGLAQAAYRNNIELVDTYFNIILRSTLSSNSKVHLLGQALFVAMQAGHLDLLLRIMGCILTSRLPEEEQVRLLEARDLREDESGFALLDAIDNNRFGVVHLFMSTLLDSDLSIQKQLILLDRVMLVAMQAGHLDLLLRIMDWILTSRLPEEGQVRLLLALNEHNIPRLAIDMFGNNATVVEIYVQKILHSNLSSANKILLLKAIHAQNTLAITPGLQNNSCAAVQQYVTLIATAATLNKGAKVEIIRLEEDVLLQISNEHNLELIKWYRKALIIQ